VVEEHHTHGQVKLAIGEWQVLRRAGRQRYLAGEPCSRNGLLSALQGFFRWVHGPDVASAREMMCQEDRVSAKTRPDIQGTDGPPGQPAGQRRPDGIPITEEIVVPPPPTAKMNVFSLVDHDPCRPPEFVIRKV
jgi:hypothetical protein